MVNMVCSCQFIVVTIRALYNVDVDDCYFKIILYIYLNVILTRFVVC